MVSCTDDYEQMKNKLDSELFLFALRWDIFPLSNKRQKKKSCDLLSAKFFNKVKKVN